MTTNGSITSASSRPSQKLGSLALSGAVVFLAVLAIIFLSGVILQLGVTPDYPWLLASGDWILQHRQLPATDLFSWTAADRSWLLYQWGFEASLAFIHSLGGYSGVATIFAWTVLGLYLLVPVITRPQGTPVLLVVLVAAAVLVVLTVNMSIRPMIVTSTGLLLQQLLIHRLRRRAIGLHRACIAIFLLYVVWANFHTGFMLGLIAFLLTLVGDWCEQHFHANSPIPDRPRPLVPMQLSLLIGAALLGSMLTPYGLKLHIYVVSLASATELSARIDELNRPHFSFMQFQLLIALVFVLSLALLRNRRAVRPADILQISTAIIATVLAARFVVWAALYMALILPEAIARAWPNTTKRCALPTSRPLISILALATLVVPLWLVTIGVANPIGPLCKKVLPAIKTYMMARSPRDHLLTDPITGSCMIAAAPGVPVFIDTRFDFYGTDFTVKTLDALALKPGWRDFVDGYAVDIAVLDRGLSLAEKLALDPKFFVLYADDEAVVVRRLP